METKNNEVVTINPLMVTRTGDNDKYSYIRTGKNWIWVTVYLSKLSDDEYDHLCSGEAYPKWISFPIKNAKIKKLPPRILNKGKAPDAYELIPENGVETTIIELGKQLDNDMVSYEFSNLDNVVAHYDYVIKIRGIQTKFLVISKIGEVTVQVTRSGRNYPIPNLTEINLA